MLEQDDVQALLDGCEGDADGLRAALGEGAVIVKSWGYEEGYGHHGYDTIWRTADGRIIHAECGGCSCEGSGSWSVCSSMTEAEQLVPEWMRQEKP